MKTPSVTPRSYDRWEAETLSFLHVLLVLGVNMGSLLTETRQIYSILSKTRIFKKMQIHW